MLKHVVRIPLSALLLLGLAFSAFAEELPLFRYSFAIGSNETSFIVALAEGEGYVRDGYSLKTVVPREKYVFMKDGKALANLDIVMGKGGSDIAVLMGQGHTDFGTFSMSAAIAAIDQGVKIKIISPYVLATGGLVIQSSIPVKTWDEMIAYIKKADKPVRVGYHSPTSAPILITRGAFADAGLTTTDDPYDTKADVLYVDLKGWSNLHPAMASGQIDIVAGPDPFPQVATDRGYGRYIVEFRKMPPAGKWINYPCCAIVVTEAYMKKEPELVQAMVNFLHASGVWCTENPAEAGKIAGEIQGLDAEASAKLMPTYLNAFTESWMNGAAFYIKTFDELGYLNGTLKGKTFDEAQKLILEQKFLKK